MHELNFIENYLGRSFQDFKKEVISRESFSFFGKVVEHLNIKTDKQNNKIVEFEIILKGIISTDFFETIVYKYGNPTYMVKLKLINEGKRVNAGDFNGQTTIYESIPCNFNDNPFNIKWEKHNFLLNILIHKENNVTQITLNNIQDI